MDTGATVNLGWKDARRRLELAGRRFSGRAKRRFTDVMKEDMELLVGAREEDSEDGDGGR